MSLRGIVLVVADQLRRDHLGFAGGSARTPVLDGLAQRGTDFAKAYVTNPTCMPNRAAIFTGRWPSANGVRTNGIPLDPDSSTFPRVLREAGWRTSAVGKMHFQPMGWGFAQHQLEEMDRSGASSILRSRARDSVVRHREAQWDGWEDFERHRNAFLPMPKDYYGFDSVDLIVGHGDQASGHYAHWLAAEDRASLRRAAIGALGDSPWDQVYATDLPSSLATSAYVAERSVRALGDLVAGSHPFFLYVSFPDPHHPFVVHSDLVDSFDPDSVSIPGTFRDRSDNAPTHIRRCWGRQGQPDRDPTVVWAPTETQFRWAAAAEALLVEQIDTAIGSIFSAIASFGLEDSVAVIFTSDHGDLFGDHGLMLKHFVHYDAVLRVPLIARVPGLPTGTSDEFVSSADIAPTLLELAGLGAPRDIQGLSLLPLLKRRAGCHPTREHLLVEEELPFGIEGRSGPVSMRTVVTPRLRMTRYEPAGEYELYNLVDDPHETQNLAGSHRGSPALEQEGKEAMLASVLDVLDRGAGLESSA